MVSGNVYNHWSGHVQSPYPTSLLDLWLCSHPALLHHLFGP